MKKFVLVSLIFSLLPVSFFAQTPIIKWGEEEKSSSYKFENYTIGVTPQGHYELKANYPVVHKANRVNTPSYYKITKYGKDLRPLKEIKFKSGLEGPPDSRWIYHSAIYMKGNIYVFFDFYNKKADKRFFIAQQFDSETLKQIGEDKRIAEISGKRRNNSGYFRTELSKDSSKFVVFSDHTIAYERNEGKNETAGIRVFDSNLNELWRKDEIVFNFSAFYFVQLGRMVDNLGNVVVYGKAYRGESRKEVTKDGKPNYQYVFRSIRDKGEKEDDYYFELKDHFIYDLRLEFDQKDHIACVGFLTTNHSLNRIGGVFAFYLNPENMERYGETFKNFNEEAMLLINLNEKKVKDKPTFFYQMRKAIIRRDGGVMLLAEQFLKKTDQSGIPHLKLFNILIVSINSLGEIEWTKSIPKRHTSLGLAAASERHFSFSPIILRDRVVLLYNDHTVNKRVKVGYEPVPFTGNKNKSMVKMISINSQGKIEQDVLFTHEENEKLLVSGLTAQINNRQALILTQRGGKVRRALLTFP